VFVDIDTGDVAAACRSQVDGRASRAASDFQHVAVLAHLNLVGEPKPLRRSQPTTLPNVLSEGVLRDGSLCATPEVSVDVVV